MSYTRPFTITTSALDLADENSEQIGKLSSSALIASPQLRKQNRIRTIARAIAKLQQTSGMQRIASDKCGHWEVQK